MLSNLLTQEGSYILYAKKLNEYFKNSGINYKYKKNDEPSLSESCTVVHRLFDEIDERLKELEQIINYIIILKFKKFSEYYYFRNYTNMDLRMGFSTENSTYPKGMLEDLLKYIRNEDIASEDNCKRFGFQIQI